MGFDFDAADDFSAGMGFNTRHMMSGTEVAFKKFRKEIFGSRRRSSDVDVEQKKKPLNLLPFRVNKHKAHMNSQSTRNA